MIEIIPFEMKHLDNFKLREECADLQANMLYNESAADREVLSLKKGGDYICFAGVNYLRPGVGEVWIIAGYLIHTCKYDFFKAIHKLINKYLFQGRQLHRVQMGVETKFGKACKFAEKLGFKKEGIMKQYCNDHLDYYLYAKVKA